MDGHRRRYNLCLIPPCQTKAMCSLRLLLMLPSIFRSLDAPGAFSFYGAGDCHSCWDYADPTSLAWNALSFAGSNITSMANYTIPFQEFCAAPRSLRAVDAFDEYEYEN
eukprot:GHVU01048801.1.p2 GENE.GHVU01048801.1~~GHVU01048801.1.p2  ORF type:complete len:109 (+),score=13.74 GHVU01048801.1:575-901(+)